MKRKFIHVLYRYSMLLMFFLIPSGLYGLTLGVLPLIFFCWIYFKDYKNILWVIKRPEILFPVLLYLYIASGILFSSNFNESLSSLSTKIPLFLFPLIIGSSTIVDKKLIIQGEDLFILSIFLSLVISICYAAFDIIQTQNNIVLIGESKYNKLTWYGLARVFYNWHPTYVAMFANMGIAIQLQRLLNSSGNKKIIIRTIIVVPFLAVFIILLNSMTEVATFILLFFYFFIIYNKNIKFNFRVKVLTALAFCFISFSFFYFNPFQIEKIESIKSKEIRLTDKQEDRNLLTIRLAKWQAYLDIIKKHWLLGTTVGDISKSRREVYLSRGYNDLAKYDYNAHNEYLEILATCGLIGFLLFMGMLIVPLFKKNHPGFIPFLIIVSSCYFTESLLNRQQGILFFTVIYSIYTHRQSIKNLPLDVTKVY